VPLFSVSNQYGRLPTDYCINWLHLHSTVLLKSQPKNTLSN